MRWIRIPVGIATALALCAACTAATPPQDGVTPSSKSPQGAPAGALDPFVIEHIVFESDGGAIGRGLRVQVHRGGLVEHTRIGHARHGSEDSTRRVQDAPQTFEALVRLLHRQGFFALQPVYDDPSTADGAWSLLRVTVLRAGVRSEHQVWWREGHAPPEVLPLEAALRARGARASGPR